ncbi:MAG TPA: RNA polymerase sigma-70 factor [Mucilaginibacter sp.]|jgi:RNA polymerase sigma-70 factor (ECF subfamily)
MAALNALSDAELLNLLREGDRMAFDQLYNRYWRKLLHFAVQKTDDFMEAENLVQDVFVALWHRRESIEVRGSLSAYLTVSVKYRIINWLDRKRSIRLYGEDNSPIFDPLDNSTQEHLELSQLKEQLEMLVNELPKQAQLIFRLSHTGMSHREIAEELEISEKAVNAHLVRTRKNLRLRMGSFLHSWLL